MNTSLFFMCGPHACGKTTILQKLEHNGDIVFRGEEIGKKLYYQRKFKTDAVGNDFELEIAELELKRDTELAFHTGIVGVETWHPGNMAYAAVRNPDILPALQKIALTSPMIECAFGVWVSIGINEIRSRTKTFRGNEQWACEFYEKVNAQLESCFKMLGIRDRVTVIDGTPPIEEVIRSVRSVICKHKGA